MDLRMPSIKSINNIDTKDLTNEQNNEEEKINNNENKDLYNYSVYHKNLHHFVVKAKICNVYLDALIDTGSQVNIIKNFPFISKK